MTINKDENKTMEVLRKNWFLIVFVFSVVGSWAKFTFDNQQQAIEIKELTSQYKDLSIEIDAQKEALGDLKGDLKAIRESLDYIKSRI